MVSTSRAVLLFQEAKSDGFSGEREQHQPSIGSGAYSRELSLRARLATSDQVAQRKSARGNCGLSDFTRSNVCAN